MKKLTYSSMAAARLRANKRQYMSLVLGIFLAIFLVTTLFLAVQGFLLAQVKKTENKVGKLDAFLLDCPEISDEDLLDLGMFTDIGHVYITANIEGSTTYIGYYDDQAAEQMNRQLREGRMPETSGEIAVEFNTLLSMDVENEWKIGDTIELTVQPIDGVAETRHYTLVGILQNQSNLLDTQNIIHSSREFVKSFPAILVSEEEPYFTTGRLAVHRTMYGIDGKFGAYCKQFHLKYDYSTYANFFVISSIGNVVNDDEALSGIMRDGSVFVPLILGLLLAASLMVSCCVGISGAMDGALARRSEEIGLLRAVGATKRQIRRIFGRESLLLALIVAPVSVLLSIGVVAIFAWAMPEQMVLKLNPILLVPILLISMGMILISGAIPLRRYSGVMPMSVIRDTEVLRKINHIKSKKQFRVQNLISLRLVQLYPSRQVGSGILAMLMLFSAACAAYAVSVGVPAILEDNAAFEILVDNGSSGEYLDYLPNKPISDQSLAQIRRLPGVKNITVERNIDILVQLEEPSIYLGRDNESFYSKEEYIAKSMENWGDNWQDSYLDGVIQQYEEGIQRYNDIRKYLNVEQEMVRLTLQTIVLDQDTLAEYQNYLESGEIHIDAINAGQEVIVVAPKIWEGVNKDGWEYTSAGPECPEGGVLVVENDCFYVGQTLPMIQFYSEKENVQYNDPQADPQREDATVTVGAIFNDFDGAWWSTATILTTEEGLKNMGLYANGYDYYNIFLDGEIDQETEDMLVERLEAIAARSGEYRFYNKLESHRENVQTKKQLVVVFLAITILFTAVSVSMIVTSITRRIQSDGRRIGMLRAVGAEERTILGIYTGQVTVSIAGGFLLTILTFWFMTVIDFLSLDGVPIIWSLLAMAGLALLSWFLCRFFLRLRIREIVNKSIIDNIREL